MLWELTLYPGYDPKVWLSVVLGRTYYVPSNWHTTCCKTRARHMTADPGSQTYIVVDRAHCWSQKNRPRGNRHLIINDLKTIQLERRRKSIRVPLLVVSCWL